MYAEIKPKIIKKIEELMADLGGEPKSITLNRICDCCEDEAKEAFPYGVNDSDGKYWNHLCNECFDELGCSYVFEHEFPPRVCEYCSIKMIWCECICCADGLIPSGNGEDIPCLVCDGDAGFWICPHEKKHPLPLEEE